MICKMIFYSIERAEIYLEFDVFLRHSKDIETFREDIFKISDIFWFLLP